MAGAAAGLGATPRAARTRAAVGPADRSRGRPRRPQKYVAAQEEPAADAMPSVRTAARSSPRAAPTSAQLKQPRRRRLPYTRLPRRRAAELRAARGIASRGRGSRSPDLAFYRSGCADADGPHGGPVAHAALSHASERVRDGFRRERRRSVAERFRGVREHAAFVIDERALDVRGAEVQA